MFRKRRHLNQIRRHYVPRITPGRPHYDILDWASSSSQQTRFEVLLRVANPQGRSLLDVGCGLGDLASFLSERGIDVDYTGVDVVPEMVAQARQNHPAGRFVIGDPFDTGDDPLPGETFDVVFCSGTLNLNLGNNMQFLPQALWAMLRRTQDMMVVNLLHIRDTRRDRQYFRYDPQRAMELLMDLGAREITLFEDYLPNDFTVRCRPPQTAEA